MFDEDELCILEIMKAARLDTERREREAEQATDDLLRQMTLVTLGEAVALRNWYRR